MINKIIDFSIRNKMIIGLFMVTWIGFGIWSMSQVPIDANPDITNNQVQVITSSPSLAAEEVERLITFPIEITMATIPDIEEIKKKILNILKTKEGGTKTISAPHMIVTLLHQMELTPRRNVVIIGAKGGYLASLVSKLIGQEGQVAAGPAKAIGAQGPSAAGTGQEPAAL